jgi:hypothetical protein
LPWNCAIDDGFPVKEAAPVWRPLFRTEAWRRTGLLVFVLCYGVFFFRMTRTGFRSWFSGDNLLNTYYGWSYATFNGKYLRPIVHREQDFNHGLWTTLHASLPANIRNKKILILHDPMRQAWTSMFLVQLGYNEKDVTVDTGQRLAQSNVPIAPVAYDFVIDYAGGKFFRAEPE